MMNKELYLYSIRILTRRDYSRYKLKEKLLARSDDLTEVENLLDLLEEKKYLQEEVYARQRIQYWLKAGNSINNIINKAKQEHLRISRDFIHEVSEEIQINPEQKLKEIFERKFSQKLKEADLQEKEKIKRRAFGYFQRRGFSSSSILELF